VGGWWAWRYVQNDLAPQVSTSLSDLLDRPVEVGRLEQISLTSLKFGASSLPPTASDADTAQVESVWVNFNPWEVLWERSLSLNVTLVNPTAYIDQDETGLWIATELKDQPPTEDLIKLKLDTLRVQNAKLQLAPYGKEVEQSAIVSDEPTNTPSPTSKSSSPAEKARIKPLLTFQEVNGSATFREDNKLITFEVAGKPETGGNFDLDGKADLRLPEITLNTKGNDLLAADIGLLIPLPLTLKAGLLDADLQVLFPPDNQPLGLEGTVRLQNVTAIAEGVPKLIRNVYGGLRFQGQQIAMQDLRGRYGEVNAQIGGSLDTQKGYNLTVQVQPTQIADVLKTLDVDPETLPIALTGTFRANATVKGSSDQPLIAGVVENTQPVLVDKVALRSAQAQFTATLQSIDISNIRAVPQAGGLLTGSGNVKLGDRGGLAFDLRAQGLPADTIARTYGANLGSVTVGNVNATAQVFGGFDNVQAIAKWEAPEATYPGRGTVAIAGDTIRFQDTLLLVAGGIVRGQGAIAQNRWNADLDTSGIELSQFSSDLRGLLSGNFALGGSLDNLSPEAISAEGQVRLSQGVSLIANPLTASVKWLGDRLQIRQASAPGFDANGFVFASLEGTPAITNLDLNVNLRGYDITQLPIPIPQQVQVAGTTDFSGRLTGALETLSIAGRVGVNNLVVNATAFEPALNGELQYVTNRSLNLDVAGAQDRIALQLDSRNRPVSFFVQQGEAIAKGRGNGDRLVVDLENFPLAILNLSPAADYGLGRVTGRVNGNFNLNIANLAQPDVVGEVAIANPAIDYIRADSFTGRFRYVQGIGVLDEGELRQGNSRYLLSGSFSPGADPQLQGKITADSGRVEDILTALQIFDLTDLGRGIGAPSFASAIDILPTSVTTDGLSLLNQLRRYSEITALRDQQIAQRQNNAFLPDLSELQGVFTGDINVAFSPRNGATLGFDLKGQDWRWGEYEVNQVVASGGLENGILTLLPLRFQSDNSFLNFSGTLGGEQQSGQLLAQNIPVAALQDLFKLPVAIDGNLNANVSVAGSVGNPQVTGELVLADATVNGQTVPPLRSLFGYANARLDFNGRVIGDRVAGNQTVEELATENPATGNPAAGTPRSQADTFQLNGSVPYAFPFMTVKPNNTDLSLDVDIRNNGIALLSLFTDLVAWKGGEGDVKLQVRGTFDPALSSPVRLNATGKATFQDAVFSAKALPQDLTNVNGDILFNNDRIRVENLQGQFSNGQVTAQGTLPILAPLAANDPDAATPLVVNLDRIALNLENRFEGNVNGTILVTGAALAAQIGGDIDLSNGRVILPNGEGSAPAVQTASAPSTPGFLTQPQFNDLQVSLGDRMRVTSDPILSFVATGDLLINGTLNETFDDISPNGTIYLKQGQVNLFATQFNLQRDYNNRAVFSPTRGLDPYIDVRLITSVPEVVRVPVANTTSPFGVAELADTTASPSTSTDFGSLQTIRVQASVTGLASQIYNNLELSSSPSRTEAEIVALIGGNFLGSISQAADNPTLALASVAGSTLLSGLQNLISDATGLTDFRLFPTTVSSENARSSTLALAAELGYDITDNLSVSVLQLLTVAEPTRFSLRYRINDQLLLRGSSNLSGESRAVLEFQTRF
jgi:translocation and assembly module TamB